MRNGVERRMMAELDALQAEVNALSLEAEAASELDAFLPCILDEPFKGEL